MDIWVYGLSRFMKVQSSTNFDNYLRLNCYSTSQVITDLGLIKEIFISATKYLFHLGSILFAPY